VLRFVLRDQALSYHYRDLQEVVLEAYDAAAEAMTEYDKYNVADHEAAEVVEK